LHDIEGGLFMAFQAGSGDIAAGFEGALNNCAVVCVGNDEWNILPGIIVGWIFSWCEEKK